MDHPDRVGEVQNQNWQEPVTASDYGYTNTRKFTSHALQTLQTYLHCGTYCGAQMLVQSGTQSAFASGGYLNGVLDQKEISQ